MPTRKTVLVTGGASGIGLAIARRFIQQGDCVVIGGRRADALASAAQEMGPRCAWAAGDIADPETARQLVTTALERFGSLDTLVNNAGFNQRTPFLSLTYEAWRRMLAVNLDGCFHMLHEALPHMARQGRGCVVNISSSAAKTPHPTAAASYGASKGALNALTRQLAFEMAPYGVRVNAVCPGAIASPMTQQWDEAYRRQKLAAIPLGRLGTAEEVAALVIFLASDQAAFITGETVNINGGAYMD